MSEAIHAAPAASAKASFRLPPNVAMVFLGFASGLPYAVFTGTIIAWFATYEINARSIGVFSMSSLPYVFKFLWSPILGASSPPLLSKLQSVSRLRAWILVSLALITQILFILPSLDPEKHIGIIAVLALVAIFASAIVAISLLNTLKGAGSCTGSFGATRLSSRMQK